MSFVAPPAVVFSLLAAAVTTVGLGAAAVNRTRAQAATGLFAAFAAGLLVAVTLLHITPHAMLASRHAPGLMLAGFASGFLINRGVLALSERSARAQLAVGLTPALGIAFHSFVDGVAYAVNFAVSFPTGLMTAAGLIMHELPEGVIVYALLRGAAFSKRAAFGLAFLAAAATTPLGAALAQPLVGGLGPDTLANVFAVTAGVLLYVGAGHLLPHVERETSPLVIPIAAAGALLGALLEASHDHDHGPPAFHSPAAPHRHFDGRSHDAEASA